MIIERTNISSWIIEAVVLSSRMFRSLAWFLFKSCLISWSRCETVGLAINAAGRASIKQAARRCFEVYVIVVFLHGLQLQSSKKCLLLY